MKPLSKEELTKCAEAAWQKASFMEISHSAFVKAYKQGYAKCVQQMADEFNGLITASSLALCHGITEQRNAIIQEVMLQMRAFNAGTGLNDYTLIHMTKEYHDGIRVVKLMFNEKFFEELEKRLKGGTQ